MNANDIAMLREIYELQKEMMAKCNVKTSVDLSSSCYVDFGTVGLTVYKWKKEKWHKKHINYWRDISCDEAITSLKKERWSEA